jgi:disulfide bond formation protein DsbB
MIDEAIGKILGMAMAYGASALGMFVAYVNYRKRIVKADKIMTPAAWAVIVLSVAAVGGAVLIVAQIAGAPEDPGVEGEVEIAAPTVEPEVELQPAVREPAEPRSSWPLVGMVVPGIIFLLATWITAGLHRHFTSHGHEN